MTVILDYPAAGGEGRRHFKGKFVQLRWDGKEFLLFAPFELYRFHNQILARFLDDRGMPPNWVDEASLELPGSDLVVIGGGRFRMDLDKQSLELWDNSQVYGRFDHRGLEQKIAAAAHSWSACSVTIG